MSHGTELDPDSLATKRWSAGSECGSLGPSLRKLGMPSCALRGHVYDGEEAPVV